jgi:undecaprenyl-diphosphatase
LAWSAAIASALVAPASRAGEPPRLADQHFTVDPVADGALTLGGAGFSALLEAVLSTGEITPQRPSSTDRLLGIDRIAVTQHIDGSADGLSSLGLGAAIAFAAVDPFVSAYRDGWDAALVDALLYAESATVTLTLTDVTKVAVRRPRPRAYAEQTALDAQYGGPGKGPSISTTDSTLSFFSGHSSISAAVTATATYVAFQRAPGTWRPWTTLIVGTLLTSFVAVERVRAGAHFPTDVIAGALAGSMVGVLVPHLHRHESETPPLVVGFAPVLEGGGSLSLRGTF